jgi:hypothetical protein
MTTPKKGRKPAATGDESSSAASLQREGIVLAIITVLLYLTAGAMAFGYQDQFGFTYLSLGLEDLVILSREIVVQLALAPLALVLLWTLLRSATPRLSLSLTEMMFLGLPVAVLIAFTLTTFRSGDLLNFTSDVYLSLSGYYILELVWWATRLSWLKSLRFLANERFGLRLIQAGAGALSLFLLAFNIGVAEAEQQTSYSFCPKDAVGVESVMVQMTDEVLVCAEADVAKRLVFSRFRFAKIGEADGGAKAAPVVLEVRPFAPRCIGVPRNRATWTSLQLKNCG